MEPLKLFSVSDKYIDYLRTKHPKVYSNKDDKYTYTRKYLGVIILIGGMRYYIPLSSPKENDYEKDKKTKQFVLDQDGNRVIRKSTMTIIRIVDNSAGYAELKGTLRISNMIPVPDTELINYDLDNETDKSYKDLVNLEMIFIRKNKDKIVKNANNVYKLKRNNATYDFIKASLDFTDLERMQSEWIENKR